MSRVARRSSFLHSLLSRRRIMSDEKTIRNSEELLAKQMGEPSGPPQAVEARDPVLKAIAGLGIAAVVAGGLLIPAMCTTGSTRGATRSAKVKWEQRQQEIEQARAACEGESHE
jgi:hypothetical protein